MILNQVFLVTQCWSHGEIKVGPPVSALEEATKVVKQLDSHWLAWCEKGDSALGEDWLAVKHYEGCDVYVSIDGKKYWFSEDDQWEEEPNA